MTTRTKSDAVSELAALDAELTAHEERELELSREVTARQEILNGPMFEANDRGTVGQLYELSLSDPRQFKPDGTPTGPDAKALQAQIDKASDGLDALIQELDWARRVIQQKQKDRDAFIRDHADELLKAAMAGGEAKVKLVLAAREQHIAAATDYLDHPKRIKRVLTVSGRDNRVDGEDEAIRLLRLLEEFEALPVPAPRAAAIPDPPGSFANPTEEEL